MGMETLACTPDLARVRPTLGRSSYASSSDRGLVAHGCTARNGGEDQLWTRYRSDSLRKGLPEDREAVVVVLQNVVDEL